MASINHVGDWVGVEVVPPSCAASGASLLMYQQLFIYPLINKVLGHVRSSQIAAVLCIPSPFAYPYMKYLSEPGLSILLNIVSFIKNNLVSGPKRSSKRIGHDSNVLFQGSCSGSSEVPNEQCVTSVKYTGFTNAPLLVNLMDEASEPCQMYCSLGRRNTSMLSSFQESSKQQGYGLMLLVLQYVDPYSGYDISDAAATSSTAPSNAVLPRGYRRQALLPTHLRM
ncbi:hypothetical protein BRADI_2g49190v3 [Brachypodium distachyon]|uniref:Uncharacterized protein n=1 Tax=Brachypodium distachyon TaxID=15368 RepID=I1HRB1_BRADI|nr:hypothetical protein BRADI_2g49190v3 [Brachypodium distachyon]